MRGRRHSVTFAKEDQFVFITNSASYMVCVKALKTVATVAAHTANPPASALRETNSE